MSKIWSPHHAHSFLSMLDGTNSVETMVKRYKELGYTSCTLSEHGNLFSSIQLEKQCKKAELKPIHAIELYLTSDCKVKDHKNRKLSHLVVLAKNKEGWGNLVKLSNIANKNENFYYKPRLDLETISQNSNGLISFSGHPGSDLANILFQDLSAYRSKSYEEAKSFLKDNWEKEVCELALKYKSIFQDFFLEVQLIDQQNLSAQKVIAECLRTVSPKIGITCVCTADSHYATKADATDQRALLCIALQTTLKQVSQKLNNEEDFGLDTFFRSNQYHVPSQEEMSQLHTDEELKNSLLIEEMCENYSILSKPTLPKFGDNSIENLRQYCRDGWKEKIQKYVPKEKHEEYRDRVKQELAVIEKVGLSDYFLIVKDYCKYADDNNILRGPGRGSAAGCLISYLCDITKVDPIRFGLYFERFYNEGRNSPNSVKLPDIDIDFPSNKREKVIQYIREKYGHTNVGQICTFGRMMGRGALKDVLRVHESATFDEMNKITEHIPDEAKIADELEEMRKDGETPSIIMWSLLHKKGKLKNWCTFEDGEFKGPLATQFAQAIRLEGTPRGTSKHASGIVIGNNLYETAPMIHDKSSEDLIVGLELDDLEDYGLPKFDCLGVSILDKIETCLELIENADK